MATGEKISVTLGSEELAWVKEQARRRRVTMSSVIAEVVRQAKQLEARREVLDWLREDQPATTNAERRHVERQWKG